MSILVEINDSVIIGLKSSLMANKNAERNAKEVA
jgi:hypothetical protein